MKSCDQNTALCVNRGKGSVGGRANTILEYFTV